MIVAARSGLPGNVRNPDASFGLRSAQLNHSDSTMLEDITWDILRCPMEVRVSLCFSDRAGAHAGDRLVDPFDRHHLHLGAHVVLDREVEHLLVVAERHRRLPETLKQVELLSPAQEASFNSRYEDKKKDPTTALLLCLVLGGIGAHEFYLNNVNKGVIYLVFCWTFIPGIIALIQLFTIRIQEMLCL